MKNSKKSITTDWIKSVRELSEEEADRIDEKMQKAISDKKERKW